MRVYVPCDRSALETLVATGRLEGPRDACAVTEDLVGWYPDGDDEDLEYAAQSRAADLSLALITTDPAPRRIVLAVDTAARRADDVDELVGVVVADDITVADLAAVLVDSDDAVPAVRSAVQALATSDADVPDEVLALDDHELAWFAPEELHGLVHAG